MIEDMAIRGLCEKVQKAHIQNVKQFVGLISILANCLKWRRDRLRGSGI